MTTHMPPPSPEHLHFAVLATDIVIFTLPPLMVSLQRLRERTVREFFEREDLQRKIHAGYVSMAESDPHIHVVDTSGSKEEVAKAIWTIVEG